MADEKVVSKIDKAIQIRNEVLDRFVRADIDATFFEEEQLSIAHGKEAAENIQKTSQMKEAKKKNDHLLRVIDRKIEEYRKEQN